MLDLDVQRDDGPTSRAPEHEALLAGQVMIRGGWQGRLLLVCPKAVARKAAAAMFAVPLPAVTETDLRDTLGELTHILGGNLKSLLPCLVYTSWSPPNPRSSKSTGRSRPGPTNT